MSNVFASLIFAQVSFRAIALLFLIVAAVVLAAFVLSVTCWLVKNTAGSQWLAVDAVLLIFAGLYFAGCGANARSDQKDSGRSHGNVTELPAVATSHDEIKLEGGNDDQDSQASATGEDVRSESQPVKPPRPAWLDEVPHQAGDVFRVPVASGPYVTYAECAAGLDHRMFRETYRYVTKHMGVSLRGIHTSKPLLFDVTYIKAHLLRDQFYETVDDLSVGPMRQMHGLLEFDRRFCEEIDRRRQAVVVANRLTQTGVGFAGILAALATVFGYLKLDTVTHGHYRRRLQACTATAILALAASGVLAVANFTMWL